MLSLRGVCTAYDVIDVLFDIDIDVTQGQVVSVIGANGAGKSTLLRTISALLRAKSGSIKLDDNEISGMTPHHIARLGVAHVPEGRRVFAGLTVKENLEMGAASLKRSHKQIEAKTEEMFVRFPRLGERKDQLSWSLSGGEQQMLAIGRGLMSEPKIILMDEPSLGLAPMLIAGVFDIIEEIRDTGGTVLLVEQNAYQALKISDYAYVMSSGRIVMQGTGVELLENEEVKNVYLAAGKS